MKNQLSNIALTIGLLLTIVLCVPIGTAEENRVGKTVDINTGTAEALAEIPFLTPELARAIVQYREEVGDFQFIEELLLVDGFDEKLFQKVKSFFLLDVISDGDCGC